MARIRTIKPEFWSSEQVMECDPLARLLFIGLWNFCDDAGNHPMSEKTIKALVFPGDNINSTTIRRLLADLSSNGLLRLYEVSGKTYLNVSGWKHQKIEKPTIKHPCFDDGIEVFPDDLWPAAHVVDDHSTTTRRLVDDSSTPEGKGKGKVVEKEQDQERLQIGEFLPAAPKPKREPKPKTENQLASSATWEAYATAYFNRYGTEPVRNAKINGQITQIIQRLGAEVAPHVAAYFVSAMNKAFYVSNLHPVGVLLKDCEAIHTQWATNRQVTDTKARQIDQSQTNASTADDAYALYLEMERNGVINAQ